MNEQHGRSSTQWPRFSGSNPWNNSWIKVSFCLSLSAITLIQLTWVRQSVQPVAIDLSSVQWLSQIKLGFEESEPSFELSKTQVFKTKSPTILRKKFSQGKHFSKKPLLGKVPGVDKIRLSTAATQFASQKSLEPHTSTNHGSNPGSKEDILESERKKLVFMHRFLTVRMAIALNMTSLYATQDIHQNRLNEASPIQTILSEVKPSPSFQQKAKAQRKKSKDIQRSPASSEKPVYDNAEQNIALAVDHAQKWHAAIPQAFRNQAEAKPIIEERPIEYRDSLSHTLQNATRQIFETAQSQIDKHSKKVIDVPKAWAQSPVQNDDANISTAEVDPVFVQAQKQLSQDALNLASQHVGLPMNTQVVAVAAPSVQIVTPAPIAIVTPVTLPVAQVAPEVPAPLVALANHEYSKSPKSMKSGLDAERDYSPENSNPTTHNDSPKDSSDESTTQDSQLLLETPNFIEAFDSKSTPVQNAVSQMISLESVTHSLKRGWLIAEENVDHWPTVAWFDPAHNGPEQIPLVKRNDLELLLFKKGVVNRQVEHAGFIFGKIARGWQVRFSGRSEMIFYIHPKTLQVLENAEGINEERYFFILNAEPGANAIYLTSQWGEGAGTVSVPIFEKTATYLDFTQISKATLRGEIIEEADDQPESPLDSLLSIEVVDQSNARTEIFAKNNKNAKGNRTFEIPNVLSVGNYPFYITLRVPRLTEDLVQYRVLPAQMKDYSLIRPSVERLDSWISQLEEEHSNQLGQLSSKDIVLVGVPQLVAENEGNRLMPSLEVISYPNNYSIRPYTMYRWPQPDSPYDRIGEGELLEGSKFRFAGYGIPKGLVMSSLTQLNRERVWSELTISRPNPAFGSARVIHFIGPY